MIARLVLVLCIILTGCSWKPLDRNLLIAYTAGNVIDILQTRTIKNDNNNFHEIHPILNSLSRDQATGFMIGTNVGLYFLSDYMEEWRTFILSGGNVLKWGLVIRNDSINVEMGW